MNRLAIFDVDGTLTDTTAVDDECYRDAVAGVLRVSPSVVDWSGAAHVTDAGILDWLWSTHRGGSPTLAVLPDFSDLATLERALETAQPPSPR